SDGSPPGPEASGPPPSPPRPHSSRSYTPAADRNGLSRYHDSSLLRLHLFCLKLSQHLRGIIRCLHFSESPDDYTVLINQICGTDNAHCLPAVHIFLFPHIIGLNTGQFRIGKKGERKAVFLFKFFVGRHAVLTHPDNNRAFL